jgi:predicted secreted protein
VKYKSSRRRRLLLILLAAALFAAPAYGAERTVTIDGFYDGGLVNLAVDETLVVRLPTCATGGWGVSFNNDAALKPLGSAQTEGDERVFRFRGTTRGSSSLGLACMDSKDSAGKPSRLFRVFVVLGDKVNAKNPRLRESDSGSRIYLSQGDSLFLWLPATASSGSGWSVSRNADGVLRPVGEPKFDGPLSKAPGAPGTQILEFKVVGRGASVLELAYGKASGKDSEAGKTWTIFVAAAGVKVSP